MINKHTKPIYKVKEVNYHKYKHTKLVR